MVEHYYQTTPLYYVNDRPHLGHAYAEIVSDALSRWHRLIGDEVFFLTGTDEHGMKLARAAADHDATPTAWVDEAQLWFRRAWESLEITNDDFIRTTEQRHIDSAGHFATAIYENGHIYKGEYSGWYCVSCENYYKEADLREGNFCPIHERPVEWLTEENYFFALSKFTAALKTWYEQHPDNVVPESRRNEALGLIRQGLEDFSISRTSFDWGIPVPWDPEHVFYVWFEALMNYTTAVGYGADQERFSTWWPSVRHLIGKDIVKFHTVWWPAMCMAAGIDPPRTVIAHGYLLMGGRKMSKSLPNQVDPLELTEDVGLDPVRLYLLRDLPVGQDGEFSYEGLIGRYNSDLANNLGNLLQRIATLVGQKCDGKGPRPRPDSPCRATFEAELPEIRQAWDRYQPHVALERTWSLIGAANSLLEDTEPWKLEPGPEVEGVLGDALEVLRLVAILASPAIPSTCAEVWRRIGLSGSPDAPGTAALGTSSVAWGAYPGGPVTTADPLFPRRKLEVGT
ncbi:MAG TPA: methionine--tRNA ligase [Acidimicrobiales bacterium]|jgi:methionyl-tRNA synthetase|nr:methionine--tRNA ligase [Acidimicrobiales bacterium]